MHEDPPPLDVEDVTSPTGLEPATATIVVTYATSQAGPAPAAITLRGEGSLASEAACVPTTPSTCEATVTAFPAGRRELAFRPYLDGIPARGARYLVRRGETVHVAPHFTRTQGELRELIPAFHSTILEPVEPGNQRRIWAYLPASYDENIAKHYPVVYMHDGRNLFDAALSITGVEWEVDESAEQAWEHTGAFAEVIVIGIDQFVTVNGVLGNYRQGEYNPTPTQGGLNRPPSGTLYARAIATELKPQVDQLLRTLPKRSNTATLGSSLGATISTWLGHAHADTFGRIGLMSPASAVDNAWIVGQLTGATSVGLDVEPLAGIYVDAGVAEGTTTAELYVSTYHALGYDDGEVSAYFEVNGGHTESAWARRLPIALAALFPDRRVP